MNFTQLFKDAWKLIWSNWRIWFFSLLVLTLSFIPNPREPAQFAFICLYVVLGPLFIFLSIFGNAGIIRNIELQVDGQRQSIKETWGFTKPLVFRLIIITIISGLVFAPILLITSILIGMLGFPIWVQLFATGIIIIFTSPYLTLWIVVIVVGQLRVLESLKHTLAIVSVNLSRLLTVSFYLYIIGQLYQQVSSILTLAIQSGFSIREMNDLYYVGVYVDLQGSPVIEMLDSLYFLVAIPFNLAIYTLAYLQFTKNTPTPDLEQT